MNIQDMPDNDLDELFKTAVDNVQYEFKQEAWQSMRKHIKRSNAKRRGMYWLGGLLLVLLAIIFVNYYVLQPAKQEAVAPAKTDHNIAQKNGVNQGAVITPQQLETDTQKLPKKNTKTASTQSDEVKTGATSQAKPIHSHKKSPKVSSNTASNLPQQGYTYGKVFTPLSKNHPPKKPTITNTTVNTPAPQQNKNLIILGNEQKNNRKLHKTQVIAHKSTLPLTAVLPVSMSTEKTKVETKKPTQKRFKSRLSVIAQIAPDLSMVDKMAMTDTRWNAGVLVEYELLKNLSLNTGVNYSMKAYGASAQAYTPKDGQWRWGKIPENIEATCNVLEIPINLRYYFHNQPKHRLFISSGLSSYWMLSERYDFSYEDKTYNYGWRTNNENKHMLSILNLSVGWQKNLNKKWSIQAEPFLKVPLGKVGAGKVSLKTTGIMLGVKYQLF
ncbi:outer membrane beta-barrel protein [uncultured Microscilla sp.]|uniref:outer membrane beta-barrel protein n=1 Tax=uncultured Microscilla sp. TaxID=432653 RepID=UPI002627FA7F|nr:outer membrane beta-barrel protein [uncultured Microscilla sp.]